MKEYLTENGQQPWQEGVTAEINIAEMSGLDSIVISPCPWCGHKTVRVFEQTLGLVSGEMLKKVYAQCGYCEAQSKRETIPHITDGRISAELAIRNWNARSNALESDYLDGYRLRSFLRKQRGLHYTTPDGLMFSLESDGETIFCHVPIDEDKAVFKASKTFEVIRDFATENGAVFVVCRRCGKPMSEKRAEENVCECMRKEA